MADRMDDPKSILIVDDERPVRYLARAVLERAGYVVTEAADSAEAVRASARARFDLLVTDVRLPGGTGPALFTALKAAHRDLRVLYISGYADPAVLDPARLGRDAAFLSKPFTIESLVAAVREMLDRP